MWRAASLLLVCLLVGGCAALAPVNPSFGSLLSGHPPTEAQGQTSVNLAQANFVLVKTNVFGVSKGFSLLGFITIVPAPLSKALGRMYASAQMTMGRPQTVAHVVIERSGSYWILFGIPKTEVHADIVEFRPPHHEPTPAGRGQAALGRGGGEAPSNTRQVGSVPGSKAGEPRWSGPR
jgi:hypothetical protein